MTPIELGQWMARRVFECLRNNQVDIHLTETELAAILALAADLARTQKGTDAELHFAND
jgi:hypothetical protein